MTKTSNIQFNNEAIAEYTIERKKIDNRDYVVVPVIMMTDGVHHGSAGRVRHRIDELGRDLESWNNIPVMINHPELDGQYVSASNEQFETEVVGRVQNTHVDGQRLRAEVWIDEQRLTAVNPIALEHILQHTAMDVSVGVFSEDIEQGGICRNEPYDRVASNYTPDHLALLPGGTGACSWEDGCGIRNNEKQKNMKKVKVKNNEKPKDVCGPICNEIKRIAREEGRILSEYTYGSDIQVNETGYREIIQSLQTKLDGMDSGGRIHFVEEVFVNDFVYRVNVMEANERRMEYYRQTYTVNTDNEVEMTGDPRRVTKTVNYNNININEKEKNMAEDKKPDVNVLDRVDELISNDKTHFTVNDKDWLSGLSVDQLNKLVPMTNAEPKPATVKEALADCTNAEQLVNDLPDSLRPIFEGGLQKYNEHRAELIKTVQNNTPDGVWNEDTLTALNDTMLENLAKSVTPTDYSGAGGGNGEPRVNNKVEPLLPVGIETEKK